MKAALLFPAAFHFVLAASSIHAQVPENSSILVDTRLAESFLRDLQRALAHDDRQAVAAMIHYPITVFVGGFRVPIADASALVERYDLIFTPALKSVVDQSGAGRASAAYPLASTGDSVTIGDTLIVAQSVAGSLKITRITVPLSAPALPTAPRAPTARSAAPRTTARDPRRVVFRGGQAFTQVDGVLAPGETSSYIVWAPKGELLEVRVDGVRGREIVARLVDDRNRAPIDARAGEGFRTWAGRVPASGDYRIEVVRLTKDGQRALRYVIVVRRR